MTQFAKRMEGITGSAIREIFKLLADPNIISFGGGNPARESFPVEDIKQIINEALDNNGASLLQYGTTEGYTPLRQMFLNHIVYPKSLKGEIDNVLIITGSSQGIELVSKVYIDPGDTVLVESPSFLGALQTFNTYQAKLVPVPMDDEGVETEALEKLMNAHRPKLFYCIPTFQNPTGKSLGIERRREIARLAQKYDVMVIEDDPYCDLRYNGAPVPNIKTFDESGHVILLNSFSKIISPGIRVGTVLAEKDIIRKLVIAKQGMDTHTSTLTQAVVEGFLRKGLLPGHLRSILPGYSKRLELMLDCIEQYFPEECRCTKPEGGLFVWGELPKGVFTLPLLKSAISELKVAYIPGEHFYCEPRMGENTFRLNFSSEPPERIADGMKRLGGLFKNNI